MGPQNQGRRARGKTDNRQAWVKETNSRQVKKRGEGNSRPWGGKGNWCRDPTRGIGETQDGLKKKRGAGGAEKKREKKSKYPQKKTRDYGKNATKGESGGGPMSKIKNEQMYTVTVGIGGRQVCKEKRNRPRKEEKKWRAFWGGRITLSARGRAGGGGGGNVCLGNMRLKWQRLKRDVGTNW